MEYPIDYFIECPIAYHLEYLIVDYLKETTAYLICLIYILHIPHNRLSLRIPFRIPLRNFYRTPL